jgi:preprotein translocase subunit SecG
MKKKFILILIALVLIAIVIVSIVVNQSKSNENSNTVDNSSKTIYGLSSNEITDTNTNGENTGVYIGQNENYMFMTTKLDLKVSDEEKVQTLISTIGKYIGYNIDINSVSVQENQIAIDFNSDAAPFELDNSYIGQGSEMYQIYSSNGVSTVIFDSITETLKFHFGNETEVYFTVDNGGEINF